MSAHYCQGCLTCIDLNARSCASCGAVQPVAGWPKSRATRYPWLNERIGRYRFVQYLGYGATGEVYRAVMSSTGRSYAAKIIHRKVLPKYVDFEELTLRLEREVQALAEVRSPHVVGVSDFLHEPEDDIFVVVMELATGPTLQRLLTDQHRIAPPRALQLASQILEALGDIHDRDIVHRDLKPDNIVVDTLRSGEPFVRLLDFGIAKIKGEPSLTTGFVGTPLYASPEQITDAEDVDERSDLYAVGCILYQMLVGTPPFESARSADVMRMHLEDEIPSLGPVSDDAVVVSALDALIQRAMAKDRSERFSSAAEMLTSAAFGLGRALAVEEWLKVLNQHADAETLESISVRLTGAHLAVGARPERPIVGLGAAGEEAITIFGDRMRVRSGDGDWRSRTVNLPWSPTHAILTGSGGLAALAGNGGELVFLDTMSLEIAARHAVRIGHPLWLGPARNQERAVVIVGTQRAALVHVEHGVQSESEHGLAAAVTSAVRIGADGYLLFARAQDHALRVRDSEDGELNCTTRPLEDRVVSAGTVMDLSTEGRMLVARDGAILEFDLKSRQLRSRLPAIEVQWRRVLWLASESGIVALSRSGNLYQARSGDAPHRVASDVADIAVTRDRTLVLGVQTDGETVLVRSRPDVGTVTDAFPVVQGKPWGLNARWRVALAGKTSEAGTELIVEGGETPARVLMQGCETPTSLVWSEDGKSVAVVDDAGSGWIVDPEESSVAVPRSGSARIAAMAIAANGQVIVAYSDGKVVALVERRGKLKELWVVQVSGNVERCAASSVSGRVALGFSNGAVELLELGYGEHVVTIPARGSSALDFAFGGDGHMMAVLRSGNVEVYDVHVGRLSYQAKTPDGTSDVSFSAAGRLNVSGRYGAEVRTYCDGELDRTLAIHAWV